MPETRTKRLPDGTMLNVTYHNADKQPHQFIYEDEALPGDKNLRCKRCGKARSNSVHSKQRGGK